MAKRIKYIKEVFSQWWCKAENKQYFKYKLILKVSDRFLSEKNAFYLKTNQVAKESDSFCLGQRYIWWEMYQGLNSQMGEGL